MINQDVMGALLDSLVDEVVFVDTDHIIRYMNKEAVAHYEKRGGATLIGKSIFDCHNERSKQIILEIFEGLQKGEDERFIYTNGRNEKVYMRAVRNAAGELIGYYERHEKA